MKKNPFGRRKVASAECELSVDHFTITLAMWRRVGAGMQRFASAGPQLQHERGGAYWETKALQTSRLSPNSHFFPNHATPAKRLRFCLPCEKCEWWGRRERAPVNVLKESFADEETCRDWYRIEHAGWWLYQRVAILADQFLFVVTNSTISLQVFFASWSTSSSFSRSLQQHWLLRSGLGWLWTCWSTSTLAAPGPAQLFWFLKSTNCACVKISPSVWGHSWWWFHHVWNHGNKFADWKS